MYLNQHILAKIKLILDQLTMPVLLLDSSGQVILPESNNKSLSLPEEVLANPTEPFINGAFTLIGTSDTEPLFLCFSGNTPEVVSCSKLCMQLLNIALKQEGTYATADNSIRQILDGVLDRSEIEAIAVEQQIEINQKRTVIYAHFNEEESEEIVRIIKNVFTDSDADYVCEVGRHAVAILKQLDDDFEIEDLIQYSEALQNTFLNETGHPAFIGIGEPKTSLADIHDSLTEARSAIRIGRIYHPKQFIFYYGKMIVERFLADIPAEKANAFYQTLFNKKTTKLFSDEMLSTIETFFENSLNLSETSRQMYIHRNTLVYRLDKVQKAVGLDLRAFDDAVTFKLLMLMGKQKNEKRIKFQ